MNTNLAVYLKKHRSTVGLSQIDVATKLGYSTPQFISNWERGISQPPLGALPKIAEMYKVDVDNLFDVLLKDVVRETTESITLRFKHIKAKHQ